MATLDSLEIQGIRSFSPNSSALVNFEKPLTLIVGNNGAGKTTILECLKMVTSGCLPPNSDKGKCFIHNNKFSKTGEVRARIKLSFSTLKKEKISATRFYSTSLDKSTPKKVNFRAGENVLEIEDPNGQKQRVNMKINEMDNAIPAAMSLSKAIVDNGEAMLITGDCLIVIFCHQDENTWPIDDVYRIKSRFEDLLETTRYAKAILALNKARKEQEEELRSGQSKLNIYKQQMMQLGEIRKELQTCMDDVARHQAEISVYEGKCEELVVEYDSISETYDKLKEAFKDVETCKNNATRLIEEIEGIQSVIPEIYQESVEEMETYHEALNKELKESDEKYERLSEEMNELMRCLDKVHKRLDSSCQQVNRGAVLKELIKSSKEVVEKIELELKTEMAQSADVGDDLVSLARSTIARLRSLSPAEEMLITALELCEANVRDVGQRILEKTANQSSSNRMLYNLEKDIQTLKSTVADLTNKLDIVETVTKDVEARRAVIEESEKNIEHLSNLKVELMNRIYKEKNMRSDVSGVNRETWESAIQFLQGMLIEDSKDIQDFLGSIDEKSVTKLGERIYDCLLSHLGGSLTEFDAGQLTNHLESIHQLLQCSLDRSTKHGYLSESSKNESLLSTYDRPYNALVRIATKARIEEYISFFKAHLDENSSPTSCTQSLKELSEKLTCLNSELATETERLAYRKKALAAKERYIMDLKYQLENLDSAKNGLTKKEAHRNSISSDLKSMEDSLIPLHSELEKSKADIVNHRKRLTELEQERILRRSKISGLLDRLAGAREKLRCTQAEMDSSVDDQENVMESLQQEMKRISDDMQSKRVAQDKILEGRNKRKELVALLSQNIQLKKKEGQLREFKQRLAQRQQEIGNHKRGDMEKIMEGLQTNISEYRLKIARLKGSMATRYETLKKLEQMIKSESFKDVEKNYIESITEVKLHSMAREDIDNYTKHLDIALHRYHNEKMKTINGILKVVWREVYTGSYIDYISIQSRADEGEGIEHTKSYSYR